MATEVIMPQMGESIAEGTITKWMKKPGDSVKRDEPIFEISTDKVDAEIPSPVEGTLLEIRVPEGQTVAINTVVATIGEAGEATARPAAAQASSQTPAKETPAAPAASKSPAAPAEKKAAAPPAPAPQAAEKPPAPTPAAPAPAAAAPSPRPSPEPVSSFAKASEDESVREGGTVASFEERIRQRSSPLVRKIASEHGVDIKGLEGT